MPYEVQLPEAPEPRQIREALRGAGDYLVGLQAVPREARDASWQADVQSGAEFIRGWDPILMAFELGHQPDVRGAGPTAATVQIANEGHRSAGALFTSNDGYAQFARDRRSGASFFEHEVRGSLLVSNDENFRALMSEYTSDSDGAENWLPVGQPSAVPPRYRQQRLFLRDLLAVQGTTLSSIPYIRELNAATNETGATAVEEGSAKPEVVMQFEQDDAPVRKIAAWIPATTEIIDDAPTLRGYIDTRLSYMLALREENQVLNGAGTSGNLKGILQFSGVQTQSYVTDEPQTIAAAIGKVENVDGEADGVVMNPVRYWTMVASRRSTQFDGDASGAPGSNAPFGGPAQTLWGLPVIRSRTLASTKALVGSFRLGATLFDRLQTVIRVGNQHSDYFTTNRVAVLAEERIALAVHRPDFFVDVTFS